MKKIKTKLAVLVLVAAIFVPFLALSATVTNIPVPTFPQNEAVLDNAGLLSADTISHLIDGNRHLRNVARGEIFFLMENFVPLGADIADYALEVFNTWQLGDAEFNNGILVVVASGQDDAWMVVGGGLRDNMTGAVIDGFFTDYFDAYFADSNYDMAVVTLFNALSDRVQQLFTPVSVSAAPPIAQPAPIHAPVHLEPANAGWNSTFVAFIIVIVVFAIIIGASRMRSRHPMAGPPPMGGPMMPRRRWGWGWGRPRMGGFMGGYMMGRARQNQINRSRNASAPRPPSTPTSGGFNRGGNSYGGGFNRGGKSYGGGGGISRGGGYGGGGRRR